MDFPVISVGASLPGADPQTMASAVATPLERQFGRISGVNQMTSSSQLGSTGIALQFDLNRNIDAAARDVQASINAARSQLPANLPSNPSYRKVNPSDAPILLLALTSDTIDCAADVRCRGFDSGAEAVAGAGSGAGFCVGSVAARGARGSQSNSTEQARSRTRYRPECPECSQREPSQGRSVEQRGVVFVQRHRPVVHRRSVPALDRGLQQRRGGATGRCGRG